MRSGEESPQKIYKAKQNLNWKRWEGEICPDTN